VQTIRRRKTIGRTIKSLRPSNRTHPNSLPNVVDDLSLSPMPSSELPSSVSDNHDDDHDEVFSLEFPVSGHLETVCVDVSGCGYERQFRCRLSSTTSTLCGSLPRLLTAATVEDDSDMVAEHRRLSSWRKTVSDVGDVSKTNRQMMVFSAVDVDRSALFRGLAARKTTSSWRSLVTGSSDTGGGRNGTSTSRHRKMFAESQSAARGGYVDDRWQTRTYSRSSCSWRQSLKSLLKGVIRTKSSVDLWATTTVQHQVDSGSDVVTAGARKAPISFRRANSLPRSLKAIKRHSGSNTTGAATKSKIKSVEDKMESTNRSSSYFGSVVTPAGERLGRSVSLSRCQYQVQGATSRVGRPQSLEVHIMALDEFGRPSSAAGASFGTATERRVHVSIPDQPWTKPFANVRLRQRGARVTDTDKYQSSSGIVTTPNNLYVLVRPGSIMVLVSIYDLVDVEIQQKHYIHSIIYLYLRCSKPRLD